MIRCLLIREDEESESPLELLETLFRVVQSLGLYKLHPLSSSLLEHRYNKCGIHQIPRRKTMKAIHGKVLQQSKDMIKMYKVTKLILNTCGDQE